MAAPEGIGGSPLAANAVGRQGIPETVVPSGPMAGIEQLLAALGGGGGIPPELLMQLIALLTGGGGQADQIGGPQGLGGPAPAGLAGTGGPSPIEAAMAQLG